MHRYLMLPFLLIATAVSARADDAAGYYQGKLGSKQTITLRLNADGENFAGQYRYAKYGSPIWLFRDKQSDLADDINLKEMVPQAQHEPAGKFHGNIGKNNAFVGNWTSADGKRVLPFNLERTADLLQFSSRTPRYKVQCSAPQFVSSSDFYTALNAKLARDAKDAHATVVTGFEKDTKDEDAAALPYEHSNSIDVVYADANLVSLCYEVYEMTGGAHGNIAYDSAIYTWRDSQLVELHIRDLFLPNSRDAIDAMIAQDLKRQTAISADSIKGAELKDLVINPTATGVVITIPPYEVGSWADGSWTVMLPYQNLTNVIKPDGPLARFVNTKKKLDWRSAELAPN
jgi:hypothetical protein